MIREKQRFLIFLNIVLDVALIFVSMVLAFNIRFYSFGGVITMPLEQYFVIALLDLPVHVVASLLLNLYRFEHDASAFRTAVRTALGTGISLAVILTILYLVKIIDFSRLVLLIFLLVEDVLLCTKWLVLRAVLRSRVRRGIGLKKIIIVGSGEMAQRCREEITRSPELGYALIGCVSDSMPGLEMNYLGDLTSFTEILERENPDEVIAAPDSDEYAHIPDIINACEKNGIRFSLVPFYSKYVETDMQPDSLNGIPLLNLRKIPLDNAANAAVKRGFDILLSLLAILLFSPVMLIVAMLVKLTSPGPAIFCQDRVGYGKKVFRMYKFRSMRLNDSQDTGWTTSDDSRRTRVGEFIRKYSIDELPQLFNVLKGDMSLVGPRPEVPYYVEQFKNSVPRYLVRQQVRPGMTGWAQVNGLRGDTSIEKRARYDRWYIENWSLLLDLRILLKTALGGFVNDETIGGENGE